MPKIVELRQDRSLICPNFDGYKLSLESVPILRQELSSSPLKAKPDDNQYSLLHANLFSMQNLLIVDPWIRTQSYFINRMGMIIRCAYDEKSGKPVKQQMVYSLTVAESSRSGCYNYSLRFLSEKLCLLCDGIKNVMLFETGDRMKAAEWKLIATCEVTGCGIPENEQCYIIYDARLDIIQERKQISIILGHVQSVELSGTSEGTAAHFLYLHWSNWILKDDVWNFEILDTLEGKGSLYYCAFEPKAESVVISSNYEYKWRSRNYEEDGAQSECKQTNKMAMPQLHGEPDNEIYQLPNFSWSQTNANVVIKFAVKEAEDKSDYKIRTILNKITVEYYDEVLLDHELFDKIVCDMTTWTIENNILQITLLKRETGVIWPSLLAVRGITEDNKDNYLGNCLEVKQQSIFNLEAPIEDCDLPMGTAEEDITISRYNLFTKTITHTVLMGSSPPLFSPCLRPGFPPALATRQDVDCCLWLQHYNPLKPEEWYLRHEGNLHALGYIQASKQQKKYMDCSPDLGYTLISEFNRHIFLYKTKYDNAVGLRNRIGPQVTIGKQHLITLDDSAEILGVTTANNIATLLMEKCVLFLQLES